MSRRKKLLDADVKNELYNMNNKKNTEEAIQIFLRVKQLEGVTERTIGRYLEVFHVISRDIKVLKMETDLVNLTINDIEDLILFWKKEVAVATINGRLRVLKPFFKELDKRGYLTVNPISNIKKLKEMEVIKDTLDDSEVKELINYFKYNKTFAGYRNLVIFNLLLDTGIRVGECLNIKINDINEDSIVIRLTKNGKERLVYPSLNCLSLINKYLKIRGADVKTDILFINVDDEPLKIRTYQEVLSTAGKNCGIKKKVGPHMCRRTYAKNSILAGMDVFSLSRLLGHSTLEVTKNYAQIWSNDLKKQSTKTKDLSNLFR